MSDDAAPTSTRAVRSGCLPPASVQVGPILWSLDCSPSAVADLVDHGFRGQTSAQQARIQIDPNLAAGALEVTTLHEVLHAVWEQTGLAQAIEMARDRPVEQLEELIVNHLTPVVLQVLLDNPALVAWLLAPAAPKLSACLAG